MFPGVSFNEVDLDDWKLPSQGHFIVTLRWTLLSMNGGNIRSLGSHKKTRVLSFFVSCCIQIYDLKGYADTSQYRLFLRHGGNTICTGASLSHRLHQIQTQQCDAVGSQSHHWWASLDRMRKNWLNPIAGWWFLIVLAKIWSNLSKTLPAAMWRDLHAEALACRVRTETKESYQEASS